LCSSSWGVLALTRFLLVTFLCASKEKLPARRRRVEALLSELPAPRSGTEVRPARRRAEALLL